MFLRGLFFAKFIIRTSKFIHRKLINSLLKSPLSWFDVTPTGRILARTIKDQYEVDNTLPYNLQGSSQNLLVLFSAIILISIATPPYIFIAIISLYIYSKLMKKYLNASR
jgi:ATP-binding cassette subfamily C (CFTR/MRP) protein 1